MASLDDLLRDLENQHRAAAPQPPDNGLDQTLAALQQEYQARPQPTGEKSSQGDRLSSMLQALEQETTANKLKDCEKNHRLYQDINRLIAEQQQQAQQPLPETDLKAIAAAEKQKQAQARYWRTKAETWLKQLDPLSNEGLWFMDFAEGYDSQLAAAIEYLQALE
ncbi:salt stress protein, Slr1339 family [Picosynechococcus sp. PCC 73109]|uniref:salt stress protein, Slr1339 family n=1 Tax=Picosynechococcus sp. PCC 73109 TaxID=374982 RepID=UPI0007458290|nr:hypothetical protein [Picosynechococcus sp. PCC 73109]AMA09165.1 hypothetical protein AWQ23_07455 [Picosynechococcus sp. PCC 73109]